MTGGALTRARRGGLPSARSGALPLLVALALLAVFAAPAAVAAPAAAATAARPSHPYQPKPPAQFEIGRVTLSATTRTGGAALLIPVHYPIQYSGRLVPLRVELRGAGGRVRAWALHERVGAGELRAPERRRRFTYVHRVDLKPALARRARGGELEVSVSADDIVDVNQDGIPELSSNEGIGQLPPLGSASGRRTLCSSVPRLRVRPGKRLSIPLPACSSPTRWRLGNPAPRGTARIRHGRLVYRAPRGFHGAESIALVGRPSGRGASSSATPLTALIPASVVVNVAPSSAVVRALGDSVTAGFGYYGDGESMSILSLYECRPGVTYNDACSSNSEVTSNSSKIFQYAPDYGLANNISWAAQWANAHGVTNYENLAISGSEPKDWAPGGKLYEKTEEIESEDPDFLLMTVGANPLLSEMLFGAENMGCAIYADVFGHYAECIERAFAGVQLQAHLKSLYTELVTKTNATVYLMEYPLTVPSSALAYDATQIAEMGQLLNREIAKVAAEVSPQRLLPIAPPHFNVGISVEPVYPSKYTCSYLEYGVDGPSVQSTPTQDELDVLHHLSFCPGPKPKGPPWVISGDTGIHPSAAGYTQMAARIPAP